MIQTSFLDPVLNFLLGFDYWLILGLISLFVSVLTVVVYKYTTDQNLMKRLKAEMKEFQKEMRELRDKPDEMMKVQKKSMETNMKYMSMSFKSTLYTMIPLMLLFGWMGSHLAYLPVQPGQSVSFVVEFNEGVVGNVSLKSLNSSILEIIGSDSVEVVGSKILVNVKALKEGSSSIELSINGEKQLVNIVVSNDKFYAPSIQKFRNSINFKQASLNYEKVLPFGHLFGNYPGWLLSYILMSMFFSTFLRRMLNVV